MEDKKTNLQKIDTETALTPLERDYALTKSIGGKSLAENLRETNNKLAKQDKELNVHYGRSKTHARWMLIRMHEATTNPIRQLSMLSAESKKRKEALIENVQRLYDSKREVEKLEERLKYNSNEQIKQDIMVELSTKSKQLENSQKYLEGCMQDVNDIDAGIEAAKEKFRQEKGRDFTPEDLELEDAKGHVEHAFYLATNDMRMNNAIALSAQGYLAQFGVNLSMAKADIQEYLQREREWAELDHFEKNKKKFNAQLKVCREDYKEFREAYHNAEGAKERADLQKKINHVGDVLMRLEGQESRWKFLKKQFRGKVKKRHVSGVEFHEFARKMSEKYADAAMAKLKVFGLPEEFLKENIRESGLDE